MMQAISKAGHTELVIDIHIYNVETPNFRERESSKAQRITEKRENS